MTLIPQTAAAKAQGFATETGIVNFHTAVDKTKVHPGVDDPTVIGGELIIWWDDIEHVEGVYDWSVVDAHFDYWGRVGKQLDIRLSTLHNRPNNTPQWLFDKYRVRRVGRGSWCAFEDAADLGGYETGDGATITTDPAQVISQSGSLRAEAADAGTHRVLVFGREIALDAGREYSVQFEQRAPEGQACAVRVLDRESGAVIATHAFTGTGAVRTESIPVHLPEDGRALVEWTLEGPGEVTLDNINIILIRDDVEWEMSSAGVPAWRPVRGAEAVDGGFLVDGGKIANDPAVLPVQESRGYAVRFAVAGESASTVSLRLVDGGTGRVEKEKSWAVGEGSSTTLAEVFEHVPGPGYRIELESTGAVRITELRHLIVTDRVPCFPNYFDETFVTHWFDFVRAFADRYRDHPHLGRVSIGGFGRWEEVMLDEDRYDLLTPQWMAHGYTRERYLAHIARCMDFYEEVLPGVPKRICLAYGLHDQPDVDWTYRRVAQEAVKRGIGLKQNGLSERYDTWEGTDNTNGSYLFNRYRYDERINTTYETGGQMYNNGWDVMGHPIPVINRAMLDGTDTCFFYGIDIWTRSINKYFHTFQEQAGRPLVTKFAARMLDATMRNDHSPIPVRYHHLWMGIRLLPDGNTEAVSHGGERCVLITGAAASFDIDDRQQYQGMFSPSLSVEYWKSTDEPLAIEVLDQQSRTFQLAAEVGAGESGRWAVADVAIPTSWLQSPRNGFEDDHIDIRIVRPAGAEVYLRLAELDFIPAREWRYETVVPMGELVGANMTVPEIRAVVDIPAGVPVSMVRVPLATVGLDTNHVAVRVEREVGGAMEVLGEKRVYLFADTDMAEVPFAPVQGGGQLHVVMVHLAGATGWYYDRHGRPAVEVLAYATATASDAPVAVVGARGPGGRAGFFEPRRYVPGTLDGDPLFLVRRLESKPAAPRLVGEEFVSWSRGDAAVWDAGGAFISPAGLGLPAHKTLHFNFSLKNTTGAWWGRLSWRGEGEQFSDARSTLVPVVANDDRTRQYSYPAGTLATFGGVVDQLRFEPAYGLNVSGEAPVERVSLSTVPVAARWDMDHPFGHFHLFGGRADVETASERCVVSGIRDGAAFIAPAGGAVNFDAEPGQVLRARILASGTQPVLVFKWRPLDHPSPGSFDWMAGQDECQTALPLGPSGEVRLPLEHPAWRGHIQLVGLGITRADETTRIEIDEIEVLSPPVER